MVGGIEQAVERAKQLGGDEAEPEEKAEADVQAETETAGAPA
jgi:hypothetical protein